MRGYVALREGSLADAEPLCGEALALARQAGLNRVAAYALHHLGRIALRQGNLERARERLGESLLLVQEQGELRLSLFDLGDLAELAMAGGNAERAARLQGAEAGLRERLGVPLPPVYRTEAEERIARVRAKLGEEEFMRSWEAGRAMSLSEAVVYALGEGA